MNVLGVLFVKMWRQLFMASEMGIFPRSRVFRESRLTWSQQKESSCRTQSRIQTNSIHLYAVWGLSFSYFGREHTDIDCFRCSALVSVFMLRINSIGIAWVSADVNWGRVTGFLGIIAQLSNYSSLQRRHWSILNSVLHSCERKLRFKPRKGRKDFFNK